MVHWNDSSASRRPRSRLRSLAMSLVMLAGGLTAGDVSALPSFARQTGEECAACHVGGYGPQLTPHGQKFKLGGYTDNSGSTAWVPLSGMAVGTYEHTAKALPDAPGPHDNTNNNMNLQEFSGFLAGGLGQHFGAFGQVTYSDIDRKVTLDNVDLRYATPVTLSEKDDSIAGLSINNNPTIQDPFNTLPGWGFPYTGSELAPESAASPLLAGGLEHQVIGATGYLFTGNGLYAELGAYRSLSTGFLDKVNVDAEAGRLGSTAPYARLAYTHDLRGQSYSIGLVGMKAKLQPDRQSGPTDNYTDYGIDGSYQYLGTREHMFTVNASYIHEKQDLNNAFDAGEAESSGATLNSFSVDGSYYFQQTYGLSLAYKNVTGSRDSLRYGEGELEGSRTGTPDTRSWTFQADWTPFGKEDSWGAPWANLRLGMQYVMYSRFNGSQNNYDGFGRDAKDNNTVYLFAWTSF